MSTPVNNALRILLMVAAGRGRPQSPSRIAAETGLTRPTATRLLQELADAGFLEQQSRREGYVAGPLSFYLAGGLRYRETLTARLETPLRQLSERFQTRAELSVRIGFARHILLAFYRGMPVNSPPLSAGLYTSAAGRLLFALSPETIRIHLSWEHGLPDRMQWPEAAESRDRLRELLEKARRSGTSRDGGSAAVAVGDDLVLSLDSAASEALCALQRVVTDTSAARIRPKTEAGSAAAAQPRDSISTTPES